MPSQVTHFLLGERAFLRLPEDLKTEFHLDYFSFGCQGPDIFYHNQRTRPTAFLYGGRLHKRAYGQFTALWLKDGLSKGWQWGSREASYLAGWVTHGTLDRLMHPYIVYHGGWKDPQKPETSPLRKGHILVERILDVVLFEHLTKRNFDSFTFLSLWDSGPYPNQELIESMAKALWRVFPSVYFWEDGVPRILNAWKDALNFLRFTDPGSNNAQQAALLDQDDEGTRLAVYHPGILPPEDFLNLSKRPWRHPVSGAETNESVIEIFNQAENIASENLQVLADIFHGKQNVEALEEALGNSSLNLPGNDGDPDSPVYMDPWDISHILDLQRRFWLQKRTLA